MTPRDLSNNLVRIAAFFEEERLPYMLAGGLALGIWATPRATLDIDFIVGGGRGRVLEVLRKGRVRRIFSSEPEPLNVPRMRMLRLFIKEGRELVTVDCLLAGRYGEKALRRSKRVSIHGQEINVASPEDVLLLKLLSRRAQDLVDAEAIAKEQAGALDTRYLVTTARFLKVLTRLRKLPIKTRPSRFER